MQMNGARFILARLWLLSAVATILSPTADTPLHAQTDEPLPRVLVTFTDAVANRDTVTLSWEAFAECGDEQFVTYTDPLEFAVSVGNNRVITAERSLAFPGIDQHQLYSCTVRINSSSVEDITEEVNQTLSSEHSYGQYTIRFHERAVSIDFFAWLTPFVDSCRDLWEWATRIFGESKFVFVCLLIIALTGGFLVVIFGLKLFKRARFRPCEIRKTWQEYRDLPLPEAIDKIEAKRRGGDMSPTLGILVNGINRWKREVIFPSDTIDYLVPPRPDGQAHHFTKIERIQRALYDRIQTHYTSLSNMTLRRWFQKLEEDEAGLLGQTTLHLGQAFRGGRVWSFFFSIEYFWNFGVIAPMFGLLGTVMGIAGAFGELGLLSNGGMIENLSGGIHEALHTTIGGLIVGLPFLLTYYLLMWRINTIRDAWHGVADEFVRKVEDEMVNQRETFEKAGLGL